LVKSSKNPRRRFIIEIQDLAEEFGVTRKTMGKWISDIITKYQSSRDSQIYRLSLLGWTQHEIADHIEDDISQPRVAQIISNGNEVTLLIQKEFYTNKKSIEEISKFYRLDVPLLWAFILDGKTDLERFKIFGNSAVMQLDKSYVGRLVNLVTLPEKVQQLVEEGYNVEKATVITQLTFDLRWDKKLNDFNFDAEPEDWKERRIAYQQEISEKTGESQPTISRAVDEYIQNCEIAKMNNPPSSLQITNVWKFDSVNKNKKTSSMYPILYITFKIFLRLI